MHKIITIAEAALSPLDSILKWLIAAGLLTMTGVLIVNVLGRTVFNVSFIGAPTMGRFLMIWLTFLGGYVVIRAGNHIAVDVLSTYMPHRVNRVFGVIGNSVAAVLSAYMAWLGYLYTATRFELGQMDVMLPIATGFFYLPVPVGFSLMTIGFLIKAIKMFEDAPVQPASPTMPNTGDNS